ncbi:MAG: agmatine deiminase [Chloroflexota bacterium]|nr:agmatine deiminase [Chloroflexota bacterium]NOG64584.1 agmatine deiminase [Chloroflexota bacterium]GIK63417.1 MAG: agmatine deiminase [Chloroflexota bacterium]
MSQLLNSTPKQDGFRMPAEYEKHAGCWMLWPERPDNWRNGAKPAQRAFTSVAAAISQFEPVTVGVNQGQFQNARALLPSNIRVVEISSNDAWIRDTGPTFVINDMGEIRGIDWEFNAWGGLNGGLYPVWDQDNLVAQKVLEIEQVDRYKASFILEGGAIHVDGQGTALVTEECLLNPNRNPSLSHGEIEQTLTDYLNVRQIIWLGRGVYLDETDGHIDNLACFIRPGVVALTWTDNQHDPQYDISCDALERLKQATDAQGRRLEVHKIHQPGPLYITQAESAGVDSSASSHPRQVGQRMAASYVNFYIANGGIVVPIFDDPYDVAALQQLQALFPERKVIGVPGREILLGGGNIHCITQQQPAP